ncbi:MAG TPA: RluA family pseudouridine synthase, partial [Chlamydiales bacterium]|nr:RluA family pseudouridine synthase [Chlamydiales bacterium]
MDFDTFFISPEEVGVRLDKLLHLRFQEKSRTYFQYLIENGLVLVGGNAVKKRETLKEGDEVEVCFQLTPELSLEPENIPLDILYEDEHLLAINKPAGMVVHPAPGHWKGTFVNALLGHCKRSALPEEGVRPGIVHRLDKETTGVLLAAKTPLCHQRLIQLFQDKKIKKEYIAVTLGKPTAGICSMPIGRHPSKRKEMAIVENGRESVTEFKLLAWSGKYSLVLAY